MSESSTLFGALLAVQADAPKLPKDKTNPHFGSKYTGLETVVETVGPILNKHGLVWVALPGSDEAGNPELHYRLIHAESGDQIDGSMPLLLSKGDSQAFGSAITYARRYALCSVLNLVADEDDDGNAAGTGEVKRRVPQGGPKASEKQQAFLRKIVEGKAHGITTPTRKQLERMLAEIEGAPALGEGWVEQLSGGQMRVLLDRLKNGDLPPDEGPPKSDVPNDGFEPEYHGGDASVFDPDAVSQ
jgi:hypothetical protein